VTAAVASYSRSYDLPWSTSTAEQQRFRRIWLSCLALVTLLGLIVPWLPVAERTLDAPPPVPPRFAKLVLERATPPPPPPPVVELPREEPPPEPTPRERVEVREEPRPVPEIDRTQAARAKAAQAGLLPFVDELADLRDKFEVTPDHLKPSASASATTDGAPRAERALVTSRAGATSGGINTAAVSRGTGYGEGSLEGHGTTQLEVPFGGSGSAGVADGVSRSGSSKRPSRTQEEIELVFDRNKAAIYALYNRALRDDPALRGKVVMQLTIAPSGEITDIRIVSSELGDAELERKLVARVRMFRFEDKDVEAITTTKPIEFFPA
jgi:periplasmic protein TonB